MKFFYTILIVSVFQLVCFSQQTVSKLSANTRQYLWKLQHNTPERAYVFPEYVYRYNSANKLCISTIIKKTPALNEDDLLALGAQVNTRAGNIWTVQVPVENIQKFVEVKGIQFIDMDVPAVPMLDSARVAARVDSVQAGIGLPQPYTGKNVVVGIIDAGFDYTHPALYDTLYQTYRLRKVWEEKTVGTPPSGFGYGHEYTDSLSLHTKQTDLADGSHGAHVSGIAAGSGYGGDSTNARFRGVAYNSDLVFVAIYPTLAYWLNTGMADMLDGTNYIFNYAQSVSKPAVVNLSWGGPMGPHDGNSLFSEALDNLTGAGKIFAISAGNNGQNKIHYQKTFTPTDITASTFVSFNTSLPEKTNRVDVWGDTSEAFCIRLSLYSNNTRTDSSVLICLDDNTHSIVLRGADGDTCFVTLTTASTEFNGKPHMLLDIYNKSNDRFCITLTATSGTVDMWQGYVYKTSGYYGSFTKYNYNWAENGDSQMQVSDMATSRSAIAVAAYNTKVSFVNSSGQTVNYTGYNKGAIANFSSHGPSADGRTKPDIAAPGMVLSSSVNSADTALLPGGPEYNLVASAFVSPLNGRTYSYASYQGTSMSSPMVSGVVALLLEANPNLTPQQVKNILAETAITDSYTGVIPANGNNTWGFGKVNAYAAVKKVLETVGVYHLESSAEVLVYPNPTRETFTVSIVGDKKETFRVLVVNLQGQVVMESNWEVESGNNILPLGLDKQPVGTYFIQLQGRSKPTVVKVIKQ